MQNQVYSRYLYQMLMEYGRVSIPSLGTFELSHHSSTFDFPNEKIFPPNSKVSFHKNVDDQSQFSKLLVDSGMNQGDAILVENLLFEDYKLTIENQIPFELYTLGTLVNHIFLPKSDVVFNKFADLLPISAKPIPLIEKGNGNLINYIISNPSKINNEGWFSTYWLPLLSSLFALIAIVFLINSKKVGEVNHVPLHTELVEDTVGIGTTLVTDTINDISNEEADTTANNVVPDDSQDENTGTPKQDVVANNSFYDGENCIFILGAFKEKSNVTKMLKKIKKNGYSAYSASYNGLERVGISFDCGKYNSDSFRTEISHQFNAEVWQLYKNKGN